MGEYFDIVCHTCKVRHSPEYMKLREIFLNQSIAAEVGRFCTQHPGHELELRGDEYNFDASRNADDYTCTDAITIKDLREGRER